MFALWFGKATRRCSAPVGPIYLAGDVLAIGELEHRLVKANLL